MAVMGLSMIALPLIGSRVHGSFHLSGLGIVATALAVSVLLYAIMGCGRALGGVAITSTMMELVPKHFMGRVQNTFYFAATCMQFGLSVFVGAVAHKRGLALAFAIVGTLYLLACVTGAWPVKSQSAEPLPEPEAQTAAMD